MSEERRIKCLELSMADYLNSLCVTVARTPDDTFSTEDFYVYGLAWNKNSGTLGVFIKAVFKNWASFMDELTTKNKEYCLAWVKPPKIRVEGGGRYIIKARFAIKEIV